MRYVRRIEEKGVEAAPTARQDRGEFALVRHAAGVASDSKNLARQLALGRLEAFLRPPRDRDLGPLHQELSGGLEFDPLVPPVISVNLPSRRPMPELLAVHRREFGPRGILCIVGTLLIPLRMSMDAPEEFTALGAALADGEGCPMVDFVNLVSGKWSIPILYRLMVTRRPIRFRELQRAVAPITQKELTKHLRLFEQRGLIRRFAYAEVPPRVEYEATELALTLRPTLDLLAEWMRSHGQDLRR